MRKFEKERLFKHYERFSCINSKYLNATPSDLEKGEDSNDISFYGSQDFLAQAKVLGDLEHYQPVFNMARLNTTEVSTLKLRFTNGK